MTETAAELLANTPAPAVTVGQVVYGPERAWDRSIVSTIRLPAPART
jgi:hypothetical protein